MYRYSKWRKKSTNIYVVLTLYSYVSLSIAIPIIIVSMMTNWLMLKCSTNTFILWMFYLSNKTAYENQQITKFSSRILFCYEYLEFGAVRIFKLYFIETHLLLVYTYKQYGYGIRQLIIFVQLFSANIKNFNNSLTVRYRCEWILSIFNFVGHKNLTADNIELLSLGKKKTYMLDGQHLSSSEIEQ